MAMTWKEFRDYVDKFLRENNVPEEIEIRYFDFSYPASGDFETKMLNACADDDELVIC